MRDRYNDYYYQSEYTSLLSKGIKLPIHERNIKLLVQEVHKCIIKETPSFFWDSFKFKPQNYNLRITNRLILPQASTNVALLSYSYRGSSCWNCIPDQLKESNSSSELKNKIAKFSVKNACNCKISMAL